MANHLNIAAIIYPEMDQIDFTGPFEVLSRLPDSTFHILWKEKKPFRDLKGLILTPETTLEEAPLLDVLIVPGGHGQQKLMEDEAVLGFIRNRATSARSVFSVCTGGLWSCWVVQGHPGDDTLVSVSFTAIFRCDPR